MKRGFTLAELLLALVILGVIATFTIPKVLSAQQDTKNRANAKEVASMISGAYQAYKTANVPGAGTKPTDLSPYINYVKVETGGIQVDSHPTDSFRTCNTTTPCLRLHNGGMLWLFSGNFGGTSSLHVIEFDFDPDAIYSGSSSDSAGKSVQFTLYYNGFLTTRGQVKPNSCDGGSCTLNPNSTYDPSWFGWN